MLIYNVYLALSCLVSIGSLPPPVPETSHPFQPAPRHHRPQPPINIGKADLPHSTIEVRVRIGNLSMNAKNAMNPVNVLII